MSLSALAALGDAAEARVFRAGAATSNVTPWLGVSLAGHMSDRVAADVHDELHARCLVLDDGTARLAIVLVDSCMVPRAVFDAAKRRASEATGIPPNHMLMAATHTHTGPCATPVFQSDADPDYQAFLARRLADAVRIAVNRLEPARIGWGAGAVPDEVFNRRWRMAEGAIGPNPFGEEGERVKMNPPRASEGLVEPAGPTDPLVHVLAVQALDGRPIALLANYSLHYVGGTAAAGEISADYFGMFAERVEAALGRDEDGAPFVAMLSNGTSGDINNINFREPGEPQAPYAQMRHVADQVAMEALRVHGDLAFSDSATLGAAVRDIALGVRKPDEAGLARAREILAAQPGGELRGLDAIYARETVLLADYPDTAPVLLQALRIGDLAIAAIPCEVFCEIGLALRAASPFGTTFTIELANGYNGYLPTAAQHALGGYETWRARSSYLEIHAADRIVETMTELFSSLVAAE
jgi:hypothetical protein